MFTQDCISDLILVSFVEALSSILLFNLCLEQYSYKKTFLYFGLGN